MVSRFKRMPAFYVGVAMALGCGLVHHWMMTPVALAFLWQCPKRGLLAGLMVLMAGYALFRAPGQIPTCSEGVFYPHSAKRTQLPFKSAVVVKGAFEGYPCVMLLPHNAKLHLDGAYQVQGRLKGQYFRPAKGAKWEKIAGTFSFAGVRYRCKQAMQKYLKRYYQPRETGDFITAISTGEMENRLVRFFFSRVGLQHILAISGFHFALIAFLIGSVLRRMLPIKWASGSLLVLLTGYAFLLGDTPSVMRSYLMIALYLVAILADRKATPLNIFGAALMLELLYNPGHIKLLGFILSYSATLGIFLLYEKCNDWIEVILPAYPKETLEHFPRWDGYGYLASVWIRKSLSLNLAVCLPLVPIILACFGHFPLISILYNLFVPVLISGVIALLLIGLVVPPIHMLNSYFATWVLELIRYPPPGWLISLHISHFPIWLAIGITSALLLWGFHQETRS